MITRKMIFDGYYKGLVRLIESPHNDGVVCQIGDNWFYFGGLTAEECKTVEEYKANVDTKIILDEIYSALNDFKDSGEEFKEEYLYYEYYLKEKGIKEIMDVKELNREKNHQGELIMKFTIETLNDNGSGMKYTTKEEFLKEISLMIDDCIANGGTFFDAQIDSDVSCFYNDEDDKEDEDEIIMEKYFDIHVVQNDENKEGYSIFVIANNKESAIEKAKNEKMFVSEYDYEDIDNIEEISEDEYNAAKNI